MPTISNNTDLPKRFINPKRSPNCMSKKKKDKPKKEKDKTKIDERLKQIASIQLPDENDHKLDDDRTIDSFWRFGLKKGGFRGTIRDKLRKKKDRSNRFISSLK